MNWRRSAALVLRRREAASKDEPGAPTCIAYSAASDSLRAARRWASFTIAHGPKTMTTRPTSVSANMGRLAGSAKMVQTTSGMAARAALRSSKSMPCAVWRRKRLVGRTAMAYEIIP